MRHTVRNSIFATLASVAFLTGAAFLQPACAQSPSTAEQKREAAQKRAAAAQMRAQRQAAAAQKRQQRAIAKQTTAQPDNPARDHFVPDALQLLQTARTDLANSSHDYNGLRLQALTKTEQAIQDVQKAIAWDTSHSTGSATGSQPRPTGILPAVPSLPLPSTNARSQNDPNDHFLSDALQTLLTARSDLMNGNHDYHGFRVHALGKTEEAIGLIRKCMGLDTRKR